MFYWHWKLLLILENAVMNLSLECQLSESGSDSGGGSQIVAWAPHQDTHNQSHTITHTVRSCSLIKVDSVNCFLFIWVGINYWTLPWNCHDTFRLMGIGVKYEASKKWEVWLGQAFTTVYQIYLSHLRLSCFLDLGCTTYNLSPISYNPFHSFQRPVINLNISLDTHCHNKTVLSELYSCL